MFASLQYDLKNPSQTVRISTLQSGDLNGKQMHQGTLYIVSAPSGAGKTSLVKALGDSLGDLVVSVSHTTRPARPGEINGREYFFVTHEAFLGMMANGEFLEYAKVFDNYYGTARSGVESALREGLDVLLEIDWQGARQVRSAWSSSLSIFILPPSRTALEQRLKGRGQDQPAVIAKRMEAAISETSHYGEYDYLIVNDVFDDALDALRSIVKANRHRSVSQSARQMQLIAGLLS